MSTIIQQGVFTSGGVNTVLPIRSGVEWIETFNYTKWLAQTNNAATEFKWQLGMPAGYAMETLFNAGSTAVNQAVITAGGFTLIDSSVNTPGLATALTALSVADPMAATVAASPLTGAVVRFNTLNNQSQYAGIDFVVTRVDATHFSVLVDSTGSTASTSGYYRVIPFNPLFYPSLLVITKVAVGFPTVLTLNVTHRYTVGQKVRLNFASGPSVWGSLSNMDGQQVTITAISAANNTISVDYDSTGLTGPAGFATYALAWANLNGVRFTPATVSPIGENTAVALAGGLNDLADASFNQGYIGVLLGGGTINLPAGQANDVIYWRAGVSESNNIVPLT